MTGESVTIYCDALWSITIPYNNIPIYLQCYQMITNAYEMQASGYFKLWEQ